MPHAQSLPPGGGEQGRGEGCGPTGGGKGVGGERLPPFLRRSGPPDLLTGTEALRGAPGAFIALRARHVLVRRQTPARPLSLCAVQVRPDSKRAPASFLQAPGPNRPLRCFAPLSHHERYTQLFATFLCRACCGRAILYVLSHGNRWRGGGGHRLRAPRAGAALASDAFHEGVLYCFRPAGRPTAPASGREHTACKAPTPSHPFLTPGRAALRSPSRAPPRPAPPSGCLSCQFGTCTEALAAARPAGHLPQTPSTGSY